MSIPVIEPLTNGRLYHSEWGLFPFQEQGVTEAYLRESTIVVWDTGMGKSHLAMVLAAMLNEDQEIDLVILVAEKGKIGEWMEDFKKFTSLASLLYHGTGRQRRLDKHPTRVLITTYETMKADCVVFEKPEGKRGVHLAPGPLLGYFGGRKVMVVYDESTKLRNRTSATYKAHEFLLKQLRKAQPDLRVTMLTATPMERDAEDFFNQWRLVRPAEAGTVKSFEDSYVKYRDPYGRATYYEDRLQGLAQRLRPCVIRKRKTDPDVMDQFPKQVEESRHIVLPDEQMGFYEFIESLGGPPPGANALEHAEFEPPPGLWTTLRQVAAHPASLVHSQGVIARMVTETLSADYLRALPSGKTADLITHLEPIVLGQEDKVVVFTFFGQSVIPLLATAIRRAKMDVMVNHGGMTASQQTEARMTFRSAKRPMVFLTSDSGARGLNLPEASYVTNYEMPLTHANYIQRINRVHRIDSQFPSVTCTSMIADYTVEEWIANNVIIRNAHSDILLQDDDAGENFITHQDRRVMLDIARSKKTRKRTA